MDNNKLELEKIEPAKIAEDSIVKKNFVDILMKIHKCQKDEAESIYEKEALYYKKAITDSQKLQNCAKVTLFNAFLEIAVNNLSIQPGGKYEAYLEAKAANIGDRNNPKWIYNARFVISAYGELTLRMRAGQIIRMNNPIVIYEGDRFQPRTNERGELIIDYAAAVPRTSKKILGCWVSMVLPNNLMDFKWLLEDDIERLKRYSIPKFGDNPKPNALYSSNGGQIDTGFLETKTIKHSMKGCTKLRISDGASFEGDDEDEAVAHNDAFDAPQPQNDNQQSINQGITVDVGEEEW